MPFGRHKPSDLELKQAELQTSSRLKLLEAVAKERDDQAPEIAKAYVAAELERIKKGELVPTITGPKTPQQIEEEQKTAPKSRIQVLGKMLGGGANLVRVPPFSRDIGFGMPPRSQQGSIPATNPCGFCGHSLNFHRDGKCSPPNAKAHYCGEVK
jgi:hypothetical protein